MKFDFNHILDQFDKASRDVISGLIQESNLSFESKLILNSRRIKNSLTFEKYIIKFKKIKLYEIEKTYYDIFEGDTLVASDINLFITVIDLIKNDISDAYCTKIQSILDADKNYDILFNSILYQRQLIKCTKNTEKKNLYKAKYDGMISSLYRIKSQIARNII